MDLSSLLQIIDGVPGWCQLVQRVNRDGTHHAVVSSAAQPFLLAALYARLRVPVFVITPYPEQAKLLHDQLQCWLGEGAPQLFPERDALPYERISSDPATVQQRIKALALFSGGGEPPPVVASVHAVAQKTVPPSEFRSLVQVIERGARVEWERLLTSWGAMGYQRENTVEVPGSFSRRGGILDIYPPSGDLPARIELLGDDVESIRLFDPWTQRSVEMVDAVTIVPAREALFRGGPERATEVLGGLDLSTCNVDTRLRFERDIEELSQGGYVEGLEFYGTLFSDGTVLDYLPEEALLVLVRPEEMERAVGQLESQTNEIRHEQVSRGELPSNFPAPFLNWEEIASRIERAGRRLVLTSWQRDPSEPRVGFSSAPTYGGQVSAFVSDAKRMVEQKQRVVAVSHQARRLSEILQESDVIAPPLKRLERMPPGGSITLIEGSLAQGFATDSLVLLTDTELLGVTKKRRYLKRRPVARAGSLSELVAGDYVVHIEHGIGRFAGTTMMATDEAEREYLVLEYAAGDRLYVPTDQIDRVGRYVGPSGRPPTLSRLGTQEWARAKQRVKERAAELARELLELYATREVVEGLAYSPDSTWQDELEASFPYVETPDQVRATTELKADMEATRPMDRLVCGDVGYGKTELAVRAAFKAVLDGAQVAMLVPTTVLAHQHYRTFQERLGAYPLTVDMLSRFRSEREQAGVIEGLKKGTIDIVIGTHRLLQKDVSLKNLGLVIIDEEQRFGVAHKERLKQMRKEVDVLTLTATPIPRTLHMALSGVRDMSTVDTPPEERLPIKTYVSDYSERLVREAVLRELDRGGQVFFVHNRVHSIYRVASQLADLVPEAEVAVAHGQMAEDELESVMLDFSRGKSDILVSTTIIESGLDIPNVNTLIVNDADKLGLGQLYQLRGRVGRSASRAYAYFLYAEGKELTPQARRRLETIFEATELGAGFRIAMRDLEIRGAGNVLGAEQSGHIGAVGFDLYCRLLREAVEQVKGERVSETPVLQWPTVDLPIRAHIPQSYVPDLDTRLTIYQRMARLSSVRQVEDMLEELTDRFGPAPRQVRNLLFAIKLKLLAVEAGVESIATENGRIVVTLAGGRKLDRARLPASEEVAAGSSQVRLKWRSLGSRWRTTLEDVVRSLASASNGR